MALPTTPFDDSIAQWLATTTDESSSTLQPSTPPQKRYVSFATPPSTNNDETFSPPQKQTATPGTVLSDTSTHHTADSNSDCQSYTSDDLLAPVDIIQHLEKYTQENPNRRPFTLRSHADIEIVKRLHQREQWAPPCLQCTIAGLPCDYTLPACSRCARKGDDTICLSQRPLFHDEVGFQGHGRWPGYTLLRLWEDDEEWDRKIELEDRLAGVVTEQLDRKNWVMPDIGGKRRGWKKEDSWMGMLTNPFVVLRGEKVGKGKLLS